jgi:hypothetical protein
MNRHERDEIDEACDARIEPWAARGLPGCGGNCRQGRGNCPTPDECAPDSVQWLILGDLLKVCAGIVGIYLAIVFGSRWLE